MDLLKVLQNYKGITINSSGLAETLGCTQRQIRLMVNELRRKGYPICSDDHGYWYSENIAEIYNTIENLQARVNGLKAAITGLKHSTGNLCYHSETSTGS